MVVSRRSILVFIAVNIASHCAGSSCKVAYYSTSTPQCWTKPDFKQQTACGYEYQGGAVGSNITVHANVYGSAAASYKSSWSAVGASALRVIEEGKHSNGTMWAIVTASVPGKWDIQVELPTGCDLQGPSVLPVLVWDGYLTVANSTQDPGEPSRVANSPADTGFIQFSMDRNRNTSGTPVDAWWVKAAGKAGSLGYVRSNATDGHLWAGGKARIRFWGTNMVFAASMLPKEYSPQLAARLSSAGFNMARLACTDGPVSKKDESLAMPDGQSVNLTMLDRLHFFASEAQNRGIYMHLVAHQLRSYCNVT